MSGRFVASTMRAPIWRPIASGRGWQIRRRCTRVGMAIGYGGMASIVAILALRTAPQTSFHVLHTVVTTTLGTVAALTAAVGGWTLFSGRGCVDGDHLDVNGALVPRRLTTAMAVLSTILTLLALCADWMTAGVMPKSSGGLSWVTVVYWLVLFLPVPLALAAARTARRALREHA